MHDIEQELKAYYGGKRLSDDRVAFILSEAHEIRLHTRRRLLAAAAVFFVLLTVGIVTFILVPRDDIASRLAEEIAVHHLANEDPAVFSSRYQDVQSKLNRLKFSILPTRPCLLRHYELVGAKYCSLQDNLAAQVKLKDFQDGVSHTLYVTNLTPAFRRVTHETLYRSGVIVELWTEGERLFGLATDAL